MEEKANAYDGSYRKGTSAVPVTGFRNKLASHSVSEQGKKQIQKLFCQKAKH